MSSQKVAMIILAIVGLVSLVSENTNAQVKVGGTVQANLDELLGIYNQLCTAAGATGSGTITVGGQTISTNINTKALTQICQSLGMIVKDVGSGVAGVGSNVAAGISGLLAILGPNGLATILGPISASGTLDLAGLVKLVLSLAISPIDLSQFGIDDLLGAIGSLVLNGVIGPILGMGVGGGLLTGLIPLLGKNGLNLNGLLKGILGLLGGGGIGGLLSALLGLNANAGAGANLNIGSILAGILGLTLGANAGAGAGGN